MSRPLFRTHELAYRTQYAEVRERTLSTGLLLPGTPGTIKLKRVHNCSYWYRVYYSVPGKREEKFICAHDEAAQLEQVLLHIEHHSWTERQVSLLRKIGFQVADKTMARVLVELHNQGAFDAGLVLVGTLAYMSLLNELGGIAIRTHTQAIDLAGCGLTLAAPIAFLETRTATGLPFSEAPSLAPAKKATSVRLPGAQRLRVNVLTPGEMFGHRVRLPAVNWAVQTVPYYEYLLTEPEPAATLAGGHCIPVLIPQASRFVWHKLYSSTQRKGLDAKAEKDRIQALTLAALLAEQNSHLLVDALDSLPKAMRAAIIPLGPQLKHNAAAHSELVDIIGML